MHKPTTAPPRARWTVILPKWMNSFLLEPLGRTAFEMPNHLLRFVLMSTDNDVNVIGHDGTRVDPILLLTLISLTAAAHEPGVSGATNSGTTARQPVGRGPADRQRAAGGDGLRRHGRGTNPVQRGHALDRPAPRLPARGCGRISCRSPPTALRGQAARGRGSWRWSSS